MIYVFKTTYLCGIRETESSRDGSAVTYNSRFKVKIVPGCYAVQMRGRGWEWEAGGGRMGTSKSSAADQGWG